MRNTITITSKGQTTLPADIRRKFGLNNEGGILEIDFNEHTGRLTISRPMTIDAVSAKASRYINPNIPPLTNVNEYYQSHRQVQQ